MKSKVIHVGSKEEESLRISCDHEHLAQAKENDLDAIFDKDWRVEQETCKESKIYITSHFFKNAETLIS